MYRNEEANMKTRTIDLLRKLVLSNYPISVKQLAKDFKVSERSIHNDLVEANEYLLSIGMEEITNTRGKGFQLITKEKEVLIENLQRLEMGYLTREERLFDLLLSLVFSKDSIFLYKKEEEYQISKSSMDEDMRRLRAEILKYGIEIISVRKLGIVLKGTERSIRTMIYDVINRNVGIIDASETTLPNLSLNKRILHHYLSNEDFQLVDQIYRRMLSEFDDNFYKNQVVLFTIIWLGRLRKNENIVDLSSENREGNHPLIQSFITEITRVFAVKPSLAEMNYMHFVIETFNARDMSNSIEWANAQLLSIQLVQFVEEQTKIPFSRKEDLLYEGLYKHIAGLVNRLKNDIQITNPIAENVKKTYGIIYEAVENYVPVIEEITGKQMSEDEVTFLVIHFSTIASSLNQEVDFVYKAVVLCNHGFATGNLLAENLKERHREIEIVAVLSSKDVEVINKLDVDLIFSTYNLSKTDKPTLVMNPIIGQEEEKIIYQFLKKNEHYKRLEMRSTDSTNLFNRMIEIVEKSGGKMDKNIYTELEIAFKENKLTIDTRELQPMLKDILTDNHILIHQSASNWEEAIEKVAVPLLKTEVIEERYVDAMIQSVKEYGPYIVIGKHLALAHARPEDGVKKLGISVATIDQPVDFGNKEMDPVKIIFCLAAVDSYSHLNIMKELVELINDEKKLEHLISSNNIQEFKQILFNER